MPPRRREIPAEGSWRLVDGENDSFDTSIIDTAFDDEFSPPSSAMPSTGLPTQQSFSQSQGSMSFASQDSIRDFNTYQDDDQVILRQPFRPSLPSSAHTSTQRIFNLRPELRPELQLRMPLVDANNLVASEASRTAMADDDTEEASLASDDERRGTWHEDEEREYARLLREQNEGPLDWQNTDSTLPSTSSFSQKLARVFSLSYRYVVIPIIIALTAYLIHSNGFSFETARDKIQSFSFDSINEIPGVPNFQLGFFETEKSSRSATSFIDFTNLMQVQSGFESVLDKSAYGLSMPLGLKHSEIATRSLRSLLKENEIATREDFIIELNAYIAKVGQVGGNLQTFYIHVGSTVDSVININRWTLRHINSLSMEPEAPSLPPSVAWIIRPLNLFKSSEQAGNDRALLDKYSEHINLVQDRLDKIIEEGKALSLLLHQGQAHLGAINDQAQRLSSSEKAKPKSFMSTIWAYIGSLVEEERNFDEQITLLKEVDVQYTNAISHLSSLIDELKDIRLYLGDLLKRSDEPSVAWGEEPRAQTQTTLSEQYEIIKKALERLEQARKRAGTGESEAETEIETQTKAGTEMGDEGNIH
ncbi:hypothetical protein MKX08_008888 [Trichoderma sp. CBMAI-0020]|nr:hypothetical protein MKX08_008888 [Trichoderma sp. CBMAI-0020]